MPNIFQLAEKLVSLRSKKEELELETKAINTQISAIELEMSEIMSIQNKHSIDYKGMKFTIRLTSYPSDIPAKRALLYTELKKRGYDSIFSVSQKNMTAFLRILKEKNNDEFPDWVKGYVEDYERITITINKLEEK